jgi:ABC-type multidrug transport system ATPase subunit
MIDIRDVTVRGGEESGGRVLLSAFSVWVEPGEKAVLFGPSGSGKTTILKAVLGFVRPDGGGIAVDGEILEAASVWRIRGKMAYVPQEIDPGEGTVREVLQRPFGYRSAAPCVWEEGKARELLERLRLGSHVLREDVRNLSGGEKQRVAFVSALLLERPVLVLDEVTSSLDEESAVALIGYLRERSDLTVLAASHDAAFRGAADTVVPISAEGERSWGN